MLKTFQQGFAVFNESLILLYHMEWNVKKSTKNENHFMMKEKLELGLKMDEYKAKPCCSISEIPFDMGNFARETDFFQCYMLLPLEASSSSIQYPIIMNLEEFPFSFCYKTALT